MPPKIPGTGESGSDPQAQALRLPSWIGSRAWENVTAPITVPHRSTSACVMCGTGVMSS